MNTVKMKWALTALVCSTMLFACKKDPVTPPEPDCSINLTNLSGAYKLTALQYKRSATATPVNYLDYMDACEKDDIVTLKSDGTYHYNDAGTVCTPNGSNDGTWSVTGNTINSDGTVNGTISSYDCKTLVYYAENVNLPGDKFTFTMVKQ
ncbi:lipocalin-like domain-containing protein [Ferruginibacter profundus]